MALLEILLLAFFLIFLVLVLVRWDRSISAKKATTAKHRTHTRKEPRK
jgi:hypothetical protein